MDMLVPLYRLPASTPLVEKLRGAGITLRHANTFEISLLRGFIEKHFTRGWADEVSSAFRQMPATCIIAIHEKKIIGFAAYDCTRKGYFGPTGVDPAFRGQGLGTALLLAALEGLLHLGYGYAIIGAAGPSDFYVKTVGAIPIPDSIPGAYADPLDQNP